MSKAGQKGRVEPCLSHWLGPLSCFANQAAADGGRFTLFMALAVDSAGGNQSQSTPFKGHIFLLYLGVTANYPPLPESSGRGFFQVAYNICLYNDWNVVRSHQSSTEVW